VGLREEKKAATRLAISDTATSLFTEHGFDAVTVAEVAAAARVSVNTVFNYFPTKEDLFFDRQDAVVDRLAAAVRAGGIAGVRNAFLAELRRDEPTLTLSNAATTFWAAIAASPALQTRLRHIGELAEEALAEALADHPMPRITAAVLAGIDRALHAEIRRRVLAGEEVGQIRDSVAELAEEAYGRVERMWD
jgi:AcrR family transcriptional regulator